MSFAVIDEYREVTVPPIAEPAEATIHYFYDDSSSKDRLDHSYAAHRLAQLSLDHVLKGLGIRYGTYVKVWASGTARTSRCSRSTMGASTRRGWATPCSTARWLATTATSRWSWARSRTSTTCLSVVARSRGGPHRWRPWLFTATPTAVRWESAGAQPAKTPTGWSTCRREASLLPCRAR